MALRKGMKMDIDKIAQNIIAVDAVKFTFSYSEEDEPQQDNHLYITWYASLDRNIKIEDAIEDCTTIKEAIDKNFKHMAAKFPAFFSTKPLTKFSEGVFSGELELMCNSYDQVKAMVIEMKKLNWRGL